MARKTVKLYGHYTAKDFCERVGTRLEWLTSEITDAFLDDRCTHLLGTHGAVYEWTNHATDFTYTLFIKDYDIVVLHIRKA